MKKRENRGKNRNYYWMWWHSEIDAVSIYILNIYMHQFGVGV